jgi:uncharacterized membrane protein YeaQ/YmgE (transglycosylase-associated protein family)
MREIAEETLKYLQENLLATVVIAFITGFLASKTVSFWGKGNIALFFLVGLLGTFLGQYAIRYFGAKEILDEVAGLWLLFDLLAAYLGSFVIAALIHFVRPT